MGFTVHRNNASAKIMADTQLKYTLSLKDLFSKGMDKILGKTKQLDGAMGSLQKKADSMSKLAGTIRGGIIGGVVGAGVLSFGKDIIDALSKYEYFSASLRTLLKGDDLQARALNDQLTNLAKTTPFKLTEVQDASKQLLAYGFAASDVTRNLRMLGDVAAGTGQPIGELTYLFGTLRVQGRAFSKDIYQFTNRGINIMKPLAKQFNTTEAAIMGMVEKGLIGFKDVEKAFQSMTSKGGQFFGMMEDQSKTVGGQLSNLGDSWEQLLVNIGQSTRGVIAGTTSFLGEMVNRLGDYFRQANIMNENFAKNGAKNFGFWANALHETIGILTGYNFGYSKITAQENFQKEVYNKFTDPKTLEEAFKNKADLYRMSLEKDKEYKEGKIDRVTADRFQATIQGALGMLQGKTTLLKGAGIDQLGGVSPKTTEDKKKDAAASGGTNISSARPQNLYITINDGLVKQMNIYATTVKESTAKVKEEVAKALLEAVNDVNQVAR